MGIKKSTMGCSSGKPVLTECDKDYIANQTSATREEVAAKYEEFLKTHPNGCISKAEFSVMIRTIAHAAYFSLNILPFLPCFHRFMIVR